MFALQSAASVVGIESCLEASTSIYSDTESEFLSDPVNNTTDKRYVSEEEDLFDGGKTGDADMEMRDKAPSLCHAAKQLQAGSSWYKFLRADGSRVTDPDHPIDLLTVTAAAAEAYTRRYFQLLIKLCLGMPSLLSALLDIYIAASISAAKQQKTTTPTEDTTNKLTTVEDSALSNTNQSDAAAADTDRENTSIPSKDAEESFLQIVCRVTRTELLHTVLPALLRNFSPADIFSYLCKPNSHVQQLIIDSLDAMLMDQEIPPETELIDRVKAYIESLKRDEDKYDLKNVNMNSVEIRLLGCVAGGLSTSEALTFLPKLMKEYGVSGSSEDREYLRKALRRLVRARPPPISPTTLLLALHRYDPCLRGNMPLYYNDSMIHIMFKYFKILKHL